MARIIHPHHNLQSLIWPDPDICRVQGLYLRLNGPAGLFTEAEVVRFSAGARLDFSAYFNLFNIGKWVRSCGLDQLRLALEGAGQVEVRVLLHRPRQPPEIILCTVITMEEEAPQFVDIPDGRASVETGVLSITLRALSEGNLRRIDWQTRQKPKRIPDLALAITTYRREAAVRTSVARFEEFVALSPLSDHLHLIVVDNGQSADLSASENVTPIANANFGGSGGFARGLIHARDMGASHCLFMDDDASTHMECLERVWAFLAYADDPATAVCGALTNAARPWLLWENGARFHSCCRPQHIGVDLRDFQQVQRMEYQTSPEQQDNFYGGWWFFAFPLETVAHLPFPFFVRGDDISFSLVHDFRFVTLPGVACFQDMDFSNKESPQTLYCDLRSHLAHHLSLPLLDLGALRTLRIAVWFFGRSLIACHYETLAALNLAFEDVIAGPEFFARNADMAERRATIDALRQDEVWRFCEERPQGRRRRFIKPQKRWQRRLLKLTLNGHFLPFFSRLGNRITLPAAQRGILNPLWGAAGICYYDSKNERMYQTRHSKRRALRQGLRFIRNSLRFLIAYKTLKAEWQAGYHRLTAQSYWEETLELSPVAALPEPAEERREAG